MRLQHSCFPVKFTKFSKTPILKNIWERVLLYKGISSIMQFVAKNFAGYSQL